jgi:hypothetical protein
MTTDYMLLKLALLFPRAPTVLEHRTHNSTKMLYEPRIVKEQKTKTKSDLGKKRYQFNKKHGFLSVVLLPISHIPFQDALSGMV